MSDAEKQIVIHLGAHRTGTTALQNYLRHSRPVLQQGGCELITLDETRKGGLLGGLPRNKADDDGLRAMVSTLNLTELEARLTRIRQTGGKLILSDENILGTMGPMSESAAFYPTARQRLERVHSAYSQADVFYLSIRNLADWWRSVMAYGLWRGRPLASVAQLADLVASGRSWRHLVAEIQSIYPETPLFIRDFDVNTARPRRQMIEVTKWPVIYETKNRSRVANARQKPGKLATLLEESGQSAAAEHLRQNPQSFPFDAAQFKHLSEIYAADLDAIRAGLRPFDRMWTAQSDG